MFERGTAAVRIGIRTGALQISPRETGHGNESDEHEIRDRPEPQPDSSLLRAAERAEPEEEAGQSRRLLRDRA